MFCTKCHRLFDDEDITHCPFDAGLVSSEPRINAIPRKPTRAAGKVVADRYRIVGLLGEGSMARVFLAEDTKTGAPVALKTVIASGGQKEERKRFFHEVFVVSKIQHDSIVRVFDVGELPDKMPYVVMEVLHGESLGSYLRREKTMPPEMAFPLMHDVAVGLEAAHRQGVVHRDVKPDNLFLLGNIGDPYGIKVVDFGLAKGNVKMTAEGVVVGTAEYMAPEQALAEPVDGRTDLYAVGVVLYRTLAGKNPIQGQNTAEILARQVIVRPDPFPPGSYPDLDVEIAAVILTALRKCPHNRYSSMDALARDLERLMGYRADKLEAPLPIKDDDVFLPRGPIGRLALEQFYEQLRLPPPR